ncbi:MAG: hypothetical protein ACRD2H_05620 [Terriglobales bacterium]
MNKISITGMSLAFAFSLSMGLAAQTASSQAATAASGTAQATSTPAALAVGTRMNAQLKSTIDARKAHVGDRVTAVVTGNVKQEGRVVIPKGSKLLGHVTAVSASSHGHAGSSVGILFDEAVTKHGRHIPLAAGISGVWRTAGMIDDSAAMGPPMGAGMPSGMPNGGMAAGGGARGGVLGGVAAPVGAAAQGTVGAVGDVGATAAGAGARGGLLANMQGGLTGSNGVPMNIEMPSMDSMASGAAATQGSVLVAPHGDVKLNSGSRVQLESVGAGASGHAQASGSASTSVRP